jgi:acetolactate synthase I/II/III large subunit
LNKPIVLAGWGGNDYKLSFEKFIREAQIPVLLTWKSIGLLDEDDPLYCGRPGAIGQPAANNILQECDFLLVLGAKMDHDQTAYQLDNIAPNAQKIVVDIDKRELEKFTGWECVNDDIGEWLNKSFIKGNFSAWLAACKEYNRINPVFDPLWWKERAVNYYCFLDELCRLSRFNDVISPECSTPAQALFQSWKVKDGQIFTYAGALGAMGQGIPGAIGAALATGRRVLCPVGDGGFMLNIQELEVVKRLNLPIKFFVMDNGGYGAIMNTQRGYFDGRFVGCNKESGLTLPDIGAISLAFGLPVWRIDNNNQIKHILPKIMASDKPEVVIVKIPDDFKCNHRVASKMVDGVVVSGDFAEV